MDEYPWRITFDTNPDTCNLNCLMCEEHSMFRGGKKVDKRMMDPGVISKVLEEVGDQVEEVIPSTMGEPLLYPHFDDFLVYSDKYGFKINLTTNGTFPGSSVERWGEKLLPRISDMKISINGSKKSVNEDIMRGLDHDEWLRGIKELLQLKKDNYDGTTITFQVTYMKKNFEDLTDLLKLAIDLGVDRFKGHHLWITWPQLKSQSLTSDTESRKRWNEKVEELREIASGEIELANVQKVPLEKDAPVLPEEYICPFAGKEAWIAWDGTFNVCCSPDDVRKRFGDFGNVKDESFYQLWNSKKYKGHVKKAGEYPICKDCNMRRPDRGGN